MNVASWLVLYCALILIVSMFGGCVPFLGKVTHSRLQFYLTASAGIMLGAAFFHVMPDAMETAKESFGWWMALGAVGLFCIERFIAPHSHELDTNGHQAKQCEHAHFHGHQHHEHAEMGDHRAVAPPVAGWAAVLGLTIHTFMNGVGLAGAVQFDASQALKAQSSLETAALWLPGLALFLAIALHKPADALAISTVLTRKKVSQRKITLVQLGFALMVPVGAGAFWLTRGHIKESMESQLTGAALAFSAGTFLFIALSDLLPEVQFHRHDRIPLFLTLVSGILLMGFIAQLEDHEHGDHDTPAVESHSTDGTGTPPAAKAGHGD